jgi:hypothetical protein
MPVLTLMLTGAAFAAVRPDSDPPEAKRATPPLAPAIIVEGPATPRWTIAPDPHLARRYAPAPDRPRRGLVIRF